MSWLEITLQTASHTIEEVAAALTAGGFADLVLEDQAEFESFLDQNREYWDYIDESLQQKIQGRSCVKLYLEDTDTAGLDRLTKLVETLREKQAFGALELTVFPMAEENWEESWKDNYPPQLVGQKLVVLPYWCDREEFPDRLPVVLDPGLTFGTGAHPSTRMVMERMEQLIKPGMRCLDLGSGSGILSIAALALGAESATGVDIDPKAEDIARENAAYSGFGTDVFTALTGNVTGDKALMERLSKEHWDVVLVNIVADVIIGLAPVLPAFLDGDSALICSGILDVRLGDVQAALERAGLTVTQVYAQEDWRCVCAKRRMV